MDLNRRLVSVGLISAAFANYNLAFACDVPQGKVLLLGDSIFDNDRYVTGKSVIDHFYSKWFESCHEVQKNAVDGDKVEHVLSRIPKDVAQYSDIVLSVGGNNALAHRDKLKGIDNLAALRRELAGPIEEFRVSYDNLLGALAKFQRRVTVCTIYTAIPFGNDKWESYVPMALQAYNQVILETAEKHQMNVLRLEQICTEPEDFSSISPIEPSEIGGEKIVNAIIGQLKS